MTKQGLLAGLGPFLSERVIGQDDALKRVTLALQGAELGLNQTGERPKASFLFMGPSGVGKTETAKAFTDYLYQPGNLVMVFMNQMQTEDSVHHLLNAIRRSVTVHPKGITLLFDEVEKATQKAVDVFLSLLDEGQVVMPDGERVFVTNCYVAFTSNVGSSHFEEMEDTPYSIMETFACEQARKRLRPELFNRITETIVYRPLTLDVQIAILDRLIASKLSHVESAASMRSGTLSVDFDSVKAFLLARAFSLSGGARRLREELNRAFNDPLLFWLVGGEVPREFRFYGDFERNRLVLK